MNFHNGESLSMIVIFLFRVCRNVRLVHFPRISMGFCPSSLQIEVFSHYIFCADRVKRIIYT
jgi:hypothetical protein